MHFRARGGSIQIVRTRYDPQTKRGASEVVGRLDRLEMTVDAALRAALSDAEQQEVQAYIDRHGRAKRVDMDHAAAHFVRTMERVIDWLAAVDGDEAADFALAVERPLGRLRRQMAKRPPHSAGSRSRSPLGADQRGRK